MSKYCIGIDLGGTFTKFGLFDLAGNIVTKWNVPTDTQNSGKNILGNISSSINDTLAINKIEKKEIKGIGIGIPGPTLKSGQVSACVNLGWKDIAVSDDLEQLTGIPVKAANDANTAALGEMWMGGGKGYSNLVMITLGTGVGGGVVIDGGIVPGLFGVAGEIGHMLVNCNEEETCGCGRKGCLEQYASATGIVKQAKSMLARCGRESSLRNHDPLTAKDVFEAAKAKDELAEEVIDQAARYIAFSMQAMTSVIDPEVYIIGGGVSQAGSILLEKIRTHYRESVLYLSKNTEIKLAELGNDAGIYGAACMMKEEY
ncbi:MAG TPA: ROK family glucokinase [Lachnospiraceae bacterium]|nr:ROK family glucokinase [Lachnospiraceae bacterium]